ncbi:MAG: hypothetical protein A2921_02395 [Candidatus Magasanikbacteria bacterium RIFCSPLOWO2_01_FULL_43_20b]|uniref:Uncharacterized protein n=1 Tax=Candidatus Magasanikbacteria bacterium RIFCSPLOWO2_12_FULL_43_12 TaxID=1798692 RepID=A0A1F6MV48_9BACT|nr:MAG: hypothetical protein A3C74_01810 [Candidatus Magasanikbacteria bacterium RIFCSPHIGHO2_02_FULL_44_13]OGH72474.1 MAG: hypothetical protein A3I93_02600 [Candidatus Magasanikbacteria bacterium RIFCSPLOWO2_02_FULL_43_22]OGH73040.1 MAG: hypothetical protein A2921_02395 [Candidatus Magasanikbacteria bacterium RIFCSPLOWO2_01_FULL_43_20b]OGH75502.1 MAG: hypothetical protein A3G00_01205 [Candidatus Magasanikbacteria bacterium RIFCSPLOWO2_12_FULL_43_12]
MNPQTKRRRSALFGLLTRLVLSYVEWKGTDERELLVSLVRGPWTLEAIDEYCDEEVFALTKRVRWVILVDGFNRKWTWRVTASRGGYFTRDGSGKTQSAFLAFKAIMCEDRDEARIWPNPSGVGLSLSEGQEIVIGRRPVVSSAEREGC